MKRYIHILPKFLSVFALLFLYAISNTSAQTTGDFPYFESFLSGIKPADVFIPNPTKNTVQFKTKGAVLTPENPATTNKFGALILDGHQFDSEAGIFVSFEYMMYGGTGGDGLSVFFYDANATPSIGVNGRGIGYSYNRSYNGIGTHPSTGQQIDFRQFRAQGLNGAYLGIAFDSYGNFKQAFYQGEMRGNGIPYHLLGSPTGTSRVQVDTNNDVVLRGAKSPTEFRPGSKYPGFDVGFVGYPVLVQQSTRQNIGHILNTTTDYAYDPNNQWKNGMKSFYLRGGKEFSRPEDEGYRRVYIEMFPNKDVPGGGFYVSVMIEHKDAVTETLRRDTIIDNYLYRQSFSYLENAIGSAQGDNAAADEMPIRNSPSNVLNATVPATLKMGFAATTGEKTDTHVIKNIRLILPRAAEAYDDFLPDSFQGIPVVFEPLLNDIGYRGTISKVQDPCPECIDEETFQFVLDDGTEIYNDGERIITHAISGMGTWSYNKDDKKVTFVAESTFKDKEARIRYNVKGGKGGESPYNQEAYRSTPATIGVKIIENPNPPAGIMITNKMVTGKSKK